MNGTLSPETLYTIIVSNLVNSVLTWLLMGIGCSKLFKKDNIKSIYAFIPGVVQYHLAVMAEREEEGMTYFMLAVCRVLSSLIRCFFDDMSAMGLFWNVVYLAICLAQMLFSIRIVPRQ